MSGISRLTAMAIQGNDVLCEASGPDKEGKFAGWVRLDVDRWHPLLNTAPIFETAADAEKHARDLVAEVRAMPNVFQEFAAEAHQ